MKGLKGRSPYTEFKKNLISDYTPEEMNLFYNFMLQCLQTYLKFRVRIQPPMNQIEKKRNIQSQLQMNLYGGPKDYFSEERLNTLVNKHEAFDAYRNTLNEKVARMIKINTFKNRLIQFCMFKEWVFNPIC